MRHIMVLNSKGGCGKSTLATNIASYYALEDMKVAIADYDPQASSLDWLARRPDNRPEIIGVAGFQDGLRHLPRNADVVIVDAPARSHGPELTELVRHAETIVVPVLPSSIDMQAASKFLKELKRVGRIERRQAKLGVIANRVRENTLIFEELDEYLAGLRIPYLTALREAQNYVRAYTRGLWDLRIAGIPCLGRTWEQWEPLVEWLDSRRSQPRRAAS